MNFWKFSLATITGSAIWCSVLAYLGAKAYQVQPDLLTNVDGWLIFVKARLHWVVLFIAIMAVLYLLDAAAFGKARARSLGDFQCRQCVRSLHKCHFDPPAREVRSPFFERLTGRNVY